MPPRHPHSGRVLVIEDADAIRAALQSALTLAGHDVLVRADGDDLEGDLRDFQPDLVVVDVMLPGRDGFALLDVVRANCDAGVLMLTARTGVEDRLRGLTTGADDYVTKPFVLAELVARVNAILRRTGRIATTLTVGDLVIDPEAGTARRGRATVALTATEFKLLCYFAEHRAKLLTKTQILSAVWGFDAYDPNLVEVFISSLRRKLEAHGPRLLYTIRGLGYTLRDGPP